MKSFKLVTISFLAAFVTVLLQLAACKPSPPKPPVYTECSPGWMSVPAGPFEMGLNPDDPTHGIDINYLGQMGPRHTVTLSAFCIQKTEVAVASYRACVDAGLCTSRFYTKSDHNDCNYTTSPGDREQQPMNCITWTAAQEYCTKMELGDLPSEAQWEKAARGTDRRLFPWGNTDVSCSRANYDSNGPYSQELGIGLGYGCAHEALPATWEVGHLTGYDGDSPYGLKDMAGNVDEWVLDCYSPTYYGRCASTGCLDPVNTECSTENDRVIRGGNSVFASSTLLTTVNRFPYGTDVVPTRVGFRCAKPDPAQPTR